MKYFTKEELQPSEKTLSFIRQIAYSYRLAQANNRNKPYCVSLHNTSNNTLKKENNVNKESK